MDKQPMEGTGDAQLAPLPDVPAETPAQDSEKKSIPCETVSDVGDQGCTVNKVQSDESSGDHSQKNVASKKQKVLTTSKRRNLTDNISKLWNVKDKIAKKQDSDVNVVDKGPSVSTVTTEQSHVSETTRDEKQDGKTVLTVQSHVTDKLLSEPVIDMEGDLSTSIADTIKTNSDTKLAEDDAHEQEETCLESSNKQDDEKLKSLETCQADHTQQIVTMETEYKPQLSHKDEEVDNESFTHSAEVAEERGRDEKSQVQESKSGQDLTEMMEDGAQKSPSKHADLGNDGGDVGTDDKSVAESSDKSNVDCDVSELVESKVVSADDETGKEKSVDEKECRVVQTKESDNVTEIEQQVAADNTSEEKSFEAELMETDDEQNDQSLLNKNETVKDENMVQDKLDCNHDVHIRQKDKTFHQSPIDEKSQVERDTEKLIQETTQPETKENLLLLNEPVVSEQSLKSGGFDVALEEKIFDGNKDGEKVEHMQTEVSAQNVPLNEDNLVEQEESVDESVSSSCCHGDVNAQAKNNETEPINLENQKETLSSESEQQKESGQLQADLMTASKVTEESQDEKMLFPEEEESQNIASEQPNGLEVVADQTQGSELSESSKNGEVSGGSANGDVVEVDEKVDSTPKSQAKPKKKRGDLALFEAAVENSGVKSCTSADMIYEYRWPQDETAEMYFLQEQICEYLAVKSFKRRYPDLERKPVEMMERIFLQEQGVVTEMQCDMGLTALKADEVHDLMSKDFPEKWKEYAEVLKAREKQRIIEARKNLEMPKLEKNRLEAMIKKAVRNAADYNAHLMREKRDERRFYYDLQTQEVHMPKNKMKILPPEVTKIGAYPVALIPGQFQEYYKKYTPQETKYLPINTAMFSPPKRIKDIYADPPEQEEEEEDEGEPEEEDMQVEETATIEDEKEDANEDSSSHLDGPHVSPTPSNQDSSSDSDSPEEAEEAPEVETRCTSGVESETASQKSSASRKSTRSRRVRKLIDYGALFHETGSRGGHPSEELELTKQPSSTCSVCKGGPNKNKLREPEDMVGCAQCSKFSHPSCLELTHEMIPIIKTYPWQCMECKTCVKCMDSGNEEKMMFCDKCDRGYHNFCVGIKSIPTGRWECPRCKPTEPPKKKTRQR